MIYEIIFSEQALQQISAFKKSNPTAYIKLQKLLIELMIHPRTGTGKPELMKYGFANHYSRRITHKHRLVYTIDDKSVTIEIISVQGHYSDK